MNRILIISTILTIGSFSCSNNNQQASGAKADGITLDDAAKMQVLIERGEYLVATSACNECHTPKVFTEKGRVPDPDRILSGHPQNEKIPTVDGNAVKNGWALWNGHSTAVAGPWGISFAANLTPHDTGIGNWTFGQFQTAIRKGKYKGLEGSRDLLPPMPWRAYTRFTDDDLRAIFAYLKSLPPVNNVVPAPVSPVDLLSSDPQTVKR